MLADAGDVHITTSGSIDNNNDASSGHSMFNLQVAGSPVNNLGLIGGFTKYAYQVNGTPDPASGDVNAEASLGEFGIGTYTKLLERSKGKKLIAEAYGGVGFANIRSDVNMDLTRYFIQPGFTFRSYFFDTSFILRFTGLQYRNFDANGHDEEYLRSKSLLTGNNVRIDKPFYVFVEPSFVMRGGYKFIKAQLQLTLASEVNRVPWRYNGSTLNFGVAFDIEGLRQRD